MLQFGLIVIILGVMNGEFICTSLDGLITPVFDLMQHLVMTSIHFTHAKLNDSRLKPGTYDVVMALNILHAIEDRPAAVQRIAALLKNGGLFISNTPCLAEKMTLAYRFQLYVTLLLMKLRLFPDILTLLTVDDVSRLISVRPFEIVEASPVVSMMSDMFIAARKV